MLSYYFKKSGVFRQMEEAGRATFLVTDQQIMDCKFDNPCALVFFDDFLGSGGSFKEYYEKVMRLTAGKIKDLHTIVSALHLMPAADIKIKGIVPHAIIDGQMHDPIFGSNPLYWADISERDLLQKFATDYFKSKRLWHKKHALGFEGSQALIGFAYLPPNNIDLKDFFDHITQDRVLGMFKILGFNESVAIDLARICCIETVQRYGKIHIRNAVIPQCAPTSPAISNFLAGRMDVRLNGYAKKNGFSYTRYADDLTFSGSIDKKLKKSVIEYIINTEGFLINQKKTAYVEASNNQLVTGINVNHNACVPKKFRKNIHTHLHNCLRFGPYANLERLNLADKINYNGWLLGNIHYICTHHPTEGKKLLEKFERINWL